MAADAAPSKSYTEIAGDYADSAGDLLSNAVSQTAPEHLMLEHSLQVAQVAATLSVGARIAALTEEVADGLEGSDGGGVG